MFLHIHGQKIVRAYVQYCKLHQCLFLFYLTNSNKVLQIKEPTIKKAYGVAVMLCPIAGQLVLNDRVK